MMKRRKQARLTAVLGLFLLMAGARGGIAFPLDLDPVTWGSGGNTLGWYSDLGVGTVTSPNAGVPHEGYLDILFDPTVPVPSSQFDRLMTQGVGYIGDYTSVPGLGVGFDFYGAPSAISLVLESAAGGGSQWEYGFTPSGLGWETFWISLSSPAGWTRYGGAADPFALALTDVSAIGFYITAPDSAAPLNYGLDNWDYGTPEPGTFAGMSVLLLLGGPALKRKFSALVRRQDESAA